MSFSVIYLLRQLGYRVYRFFYDWYIGGFLAISSKVVEILESLDRTLAFRITLRNLFKPLYGDQSFLGSILGFFFRSVRLIIAGVIYFCIISLGVLIYAGWGTVPVYILMKGFLS